MNTFVEAITITVNNAAEKFTMATENGSLSIGLEVIHTDIRTVNTTIQGVVGMKIQVMKHNPVFLDLDFLS